MPPVLIRQTSFAAGEISPQLYGRTDWQKYASAVRTMKNWFATASGAAMNRPGTRVQVVLSAALGQNWRLIPFVYSNDVAYNIVVKDQSMTVYSAAGAQLSLIPTVGAPVPYLNADLPRLKYCQIGNGLFVTHPNYPPAIIRRLSDVSWTYSVIAYTTGQFLATAGGGGGINGSLRSAEADLNAPVMMFWGAGTQYFPGDYKLEDTTGSGDLSTYMALRSNLGKVPHTSPTSWVLAVDGSHPVRDTSWAFTILWLDIYGDQHESGIVWTWSSSCACYTDRPAWIYQPTLQAARPVNFAKIVGYKYYKGKGGIFGFIGQTDTTQTAYQDKGDVPNFSQNPPDGTDPSVYYDTNGAVQYSYPASVSFIDGRLVFAGFPQQLQTLKFSEVGDVFRFDQPLLTRDNGAFFRTIVSQNLNDVRSLVPLRSLLTLCGSGEWSVRGAQGSPITPSTVEAKRASKYGSSWLDPLIIGEMALFNTVLGGGVRDLIYDYASDTYSGQDLALFVRHFFDGYYIIDWSYAETPNKLAWMVRSDGNLLGLTYSKDQQVVAWHQHNSPGATFKATSVLPVGTEHVPWQ